MKNASSYAEKTASKLWRSASILVLIGLPVVSISLLATQSNFQFTLQTLNDQIFHSPNHSYHYPFYQSLGKNDRNVTAQLQQLIAFHQDKVRQRPGRALEQAALASTYLRMARITGEGNWYLLAEQTAQRSLALLPTDNTEATAVLARVTEAKHDFAGALQWTAQIPNPAEALSIQVTSNLAMGKLDAASRAANALVDTRLSMGAFTLQALVKSAQGKDQEALQSFQYALQAEEFGEISNSARTRTLLGRFYYKQGQLKQAENLYREALQILPNYPQALLNQAQLEMRRGNYRSAERAYAQLADLSQGAPTVFDPLILRGRAQIKALQGDRAAAETLWAEAETLLRQSFIGNSTFSFGHRRDLARLLLERGQDQDIPEAIALMQAEIKLRQDAETLSTYAWALLRAERWQEAQRIMQQVIALGIRDAGLFHQAATIEQALGNSAQANRYLQEAQAVDSQFDDNTRRVQNLGAGLGS